jgi:hypothetical protein
MRLILFLHFDGVLGSPYEFLVGVSIDRDRKILQTGEGRAKLSTRGKKSW